LKGITNCTNLPAVFFPQPKLIYSRKMLFAMLSSFWICHLMIIYSRYNGEVDSSCIFDISTCTQPQRNFLNIVGKRRVYPPILGVYAHNVILFIYIYFFYFELIIYFCSKPITSSNRRTGRPVFFYLFNSIGSKVQTFLIEVTTLSGQKLNMYASTV